MLPALSPIPVPPEVREAAEHYRNDTSGDKRGALKAVVILADWAATFLGQNKQRIPL